MNIAFVQLGSFGDNINSTLMLSPIKKAFPNCNIEVHTTNLYASAFANNPHISKIITYGANTKAECFNLYNTIPQKVKAQRYDKVFVPAPILHQDRTSKKHPELGNNIICTFMRVLEDEGIEYDFPVQSIMHLTKDEIIGVDRWAERNNINFNHNYRRNVIMEVHGESGQTFWNHHWTLATSRHLMLKDTNLFISRKDKTQDILQLEREYRGRVYCTNELTIRQCAELFNRCDMFFSVSSGLSNACNTNHCKTDVKWIETVNSPSVTSAPLRSSNKIFWYDNDIPKFIAMLSNNDI